VCHGLGSYSHNLDSDAELHTLSKIRQTQTKNMFNIISTQDQSAFAMLNQRLSIDWSHWIIWIYEALVLGEKERSWLAEKNTKHGEQA